MKSTQMPKIVWAYGATALVLLLVSFFVCGTNDITLHDLYFVVTNAQIFSTIGLIFVLFTLVTWGIHKISRQLNQIINWLHYGLTILSLVIVAVFSNNSTSEHSSKQEYSVYDVHENLESQLSINEWLAIIGVILILSQLLFLINIIRAFIIKKKS